jgi:DNA-binding transcriptional LysR family regulator
MQAAKYLGAQLAEDKFVPLDSLPTAAPQGAGQRMLLVPKPPSHGMDDRNFPYAKVELLEKGKSLGNWILSPWIVPQEVQSGGQTFRIAFSYYLDPLFLPELVARVRAQAPGVTLDLLPLTRDYDYRGQLARGEVDLVIGNWLSPPAELHLGRLVSDELVCLVGTDHPAVRNPRQWTVERYLASEHISPMPLHAGGVGVVDELLQAQGLQRHIVVRSPHFGLAPAMVARSALVLTTGRQFCARYIGTLPVRIVRCPVDFPPLTYYQLWHDMTHASAAVRWLREQVRDVARGLLELKT